MKTHKTDENWESAIVRMTVQRDFQATRKEANGGSKHVCKKFIKKNPIC